MDIEQRDELLRYLREEGWINPEEEPEIHLLSGGVSSRTVWVGRPNGTAWVLKQSLEKLRVAVDWFGDPKRIHREALGMRWLQKLAPPETITPLVFEDYEHHILAMEAVPQPHQNWKTMLLAGQLDLQHVTQYGVLLGTIHRESSRLRHEIQPEFADQAFFKALRIEPYYEFTASQLPQTSGFFSKLTNGCLEHTHALVHGDYSPKNVLVFLEHLILLDHEVIHFGDPAFDVGFSLTHMLSKANHISHIRKEFCQAADLYWQVYRQTIGNPDWMTDLEERVVQHTTACLLARVAGRSPLEYLSPEERMSQLAIGLKLAAEPIKKVEDLVAFFLYEMENKAYA